MIVCSKFFHIYGVDSLNSWFERNWKKPAGRFSMMFCLRPEYSLVIHLLKSLGNLEHRWNSWEHKS